MRGGSRRVSAYGRSRRLFTMLDIILVCVIIVLALVLFATERFRADFVALLTLGVLMVLGFFREKFLSPTESITGFSNAATVTVAAMFVLSRALTRTGAITWVTNFIAHLGNRKENLTFLMLMLSAGTISAFINNTATVAVFLPITFAIAQTQRMSASKLLLPLSYASIFAGTCTLIGTSTNILVSSIMVDHGLAAIPMFELSKLGLIFVGVGLLYLFFVARPMLPHRVTTDSLTRKYRMKGYLTEVVINDKSPLIGKTVVETQISERFDVNVLGIIRNKQRIWTGLRSTLLQAGDMLLVRGGIENLMKMRDSHIVTILADVKLSDTDLTSDDMMITEAIITPASPLIGKTLKEVSFRDRYNAFALAVRTHGKTVRKKIGRIRLSVGDTLLIQGRRSTFSVLANETDFLILQEIMLPRPRKDKSIYAVGIMTLVVALAAFGVMPILASAILGCLLVILAGCITLQEAYDSIDWMVIFLLAGMIPLGIVMEKTGTAEFLGHTLIEYVGDLGPVAVISVFYLLISVLTSVVSNNASAILLAPIAIATAGELGVNPWPFLMAVTFGASASFATPLGYQTNLMVYGPGGYKFTDFVKVGLPLNIIFWLLATIFIPVFWPF